MTARAIASPILAVAMAPLVASQASTASANKLLDERWMTNASDADVRKEIAAGADVNAVQGRHNYTPLMAASKHANIEAMQALFEAGADPDLPPKPGWDVPMHWAANGQAVALLFDYGAAIDTRSAKTGFTPLHWAASNSRLDAMHALIRPGAEIDARSTEFGNTPLYRVARNGQPAAGAEINKANSSGVTPLHAAARRNSPQMVEFLLDAGADPTLQTRNGWFPAESGVANPKLKGSRALQRLVDPLLDIPARAGQASDAPCGGWRVQPGDTTRIVLADGAGDQSRYMELGRLNELSGRNMLQVGMCLELPGRKASAAPSRRRASCDGYVVQARDRKLGDVAEKALVDRSRWPEIARLNGITAEKPHRLGQCHELPG